VLSYKGQSNCISRLRYLGYFYIRLLYRLLYWPRSDAKKFILKNYARQLDTRLEIK